MASGVNQITGSFETGVVPRGKAPTGADAPQLEVEFDGGWTPANCKAPAAGAVLKGEALRKQVGFLLLLLLHWHYSLHVGVVCGVLC